MKIKPIPHDKKTLIKAHENNPISYKILKLENFTVKMNNRIVETQNIINQLTDFGNIAETLACYPKEVDDLMHDILVFTRRRNEAFEKIQSMYKLRNNEQSTEKNTDDAHWEYNDGGRKEAGYKGNTGDCGVRAIAIATGKDYKEVYDLVNDYGKNWERKSKSRSGKSSAREGIYSSTFKKIMLDLGWKWQATMQIGSGCKVHLKADELPKGRIICNVSKHYVALIDGVIQDTHDCSRNGTRCVYGYFYEPDENGWESWSIQ